MDVIEIVAKYLDDNGYDGLYEPGECACKKDEIAPCGQINGTCEPGHFIGEACSEHEFHIGVKGSKCICTE